MNNCGIDNLLAEFNSLQNIYGDSTLDPIISGGEFNNPKICFVFMNPTGRNVAANKEWKDIKAPWLGTKNIWEMFYKLALIDSDIYSDIKSRKPTDWDYDFANRVYENIKKKGVYITNLAKCTQTDARALPDRIFKEYLKLLDEELNIVKPMKIVTLGNQVSSIFLGKKISVSQTRKIIFERNNTKVLPVYYPVGQGRRNMDLAVEDIKWFMDNK